MQSGNPLHINLARVAEKGGRLEIELADRFFADLEQEEISGGDVHVSVAVRSSADAVYKVEIAAKGCVTVPCDRCLDPLQLEVDTKELVYVKDDEPGEGDSPDMLYTEADGTCDLSWCVYEIVETSLPMQRTHDVDDCNSDMLSRMVAEGDEDREDDDELA